MSVHRDYGQAVDRIRQAGLPTTRDNILVAKLILDRKAPPSLEDLLDDVYEEGLGLSPDTLTSIMERFRCVGLLRAGELPRRQAATRSAPRLGSDHAHAVSVLLKAIGNPWRYKILCLLADGERSVGALERDLGIAQSALSQHLARLRELGLVQTRRQRQRVIYSLASSAVAALVGILCQACDGILQPPS